MKRARVLAVLDRHKRILPASVTERIRSSFADVDKVLDRLPECGGDFALDVGCGCAVASFALAEHFDRVIGIDTDPRGIYVARYLAARAGVSNVSFELADAETFSRVRGADFVFCNLMSHYGRSRIALARRLRDASKAGAWIFYSEATEGYALMEVAQALDERDPRHARKQVLRLLNAVLGRPGLRFFFSGTAGSVLDSVGWSVAADERKRWRSLTISESTWAQARPADGSDDPPWSPDYAAEPPGLAGLRRTCQAWVSRRGPDELSVPLREEIICFHRSGREPLAPWALVLLIAEAALGSWQPRRDVGRLIPRWRASAGSQRIDWGALSESIDSLLEQLERRT